MRPDAQPNKRRRLNYVCTIVLVQAGCVAVGLWMQHQFLQSSARDAAMNAAWDEMTSDAVRIAGAISSLAGESEARGALPRVAAMERVIDDLKVSAGATLIVDSRWHVIYVPGDGADLALPPQADTAVPWNPAPASKSADGSGVRGMLELLGGAHIASAASLGHVRGFAVVHRPLAEVENAASSLLEPLPAISGLTFVWTCALLGISAYMVFARFHDEVERERVRSVATGLRQRQELVRTRDAIVFGLAKLADSRDPETGDHLERISVYSTMLANVLRHYPEYGHQVTPAFVRTIGISSVLHDIGKVGVADDILLKPGPLTSQERRTMQAHAAIGGECLRGIEQRLGSSNFLQMARHIAYAHHERWDGTGYPRGLRGEEIPLAARIVAVADVYDALSSRRAYKDAQPHEECVEAIRAASGTHFDPVLVEAWLSIAPRFAEVAIRYASYIRPASAAIGSVLEPSGDGADDEMIQDVEEVDALEERAPLASTADRMGC